MNYEKKETKVEISEAEKKTAAADDILAEYNDQTGDDNVHFYHVDGYTYGDYTDSCCC